ncbi:S-layer homology domain-containing protein [Flavonifractor sp. HCP28S3_F3]|uniref:S-layer homology domain-containing protein n=1 Tax=Flavonifractor sp. HCP28S3_F3 TaxID=3438939 RepID=UPI003F8B07E9
MKRRIWAGLLSLCLLIGMLPTSAFAADGGDAEVSTLPAYTEEYTSRDAETDETSIAVLDAGDPGTSADNPLEVPTEGLNISGGICKGISSTWFDQINQNQSTVYLSVKIPSNVTTIDTNSFSFLLPANAKLVSLDFSEATALTTIKNQAALNCSSLTGVLDLSNTKVTTIEVNAFRGCTGLTGVVLPDSLTTLGKADGSSGSVFLECSSLRFVTTSDKYNLHKDDPDFTDFSLPDGLVTIGKNTFANAFADVDLTLVIPASVTTIGSEAFYPRSGSAAELSYQPIKVIIVKGTDVSGFAEKAFKFYDSGAPAEYQSSPRVVVMPDKDTYDTFMKKAGGNTPDKNAITYSLTVSYYNGETAEGTPYCTEEKLYKQSIRYTKQGDLWSYDESYALPEVPGGAGPKPGYTDSVWMMNGKELTVDSTVTSDTVTLAGGDLMEPEVTFTVEHNPRNSSSWTETVANGSTITVNLAEDQSVDIVPNIQHDLAGNKAGDIFFWYRWQDSTGARNDDGEDFEFGEQINTLRIDALDEARTSADNQYYYIDIEGKTVSSSWGPSYSFDGTPIYTSDDHTYHIHVNVVRVENLAYVAASDYEYFIEHEPEEYAMLSTYPTAEDLIEDYLIGVFGEETYLESESWEGESLPISWQLKPGTEYSSASEAENTFVWTVSQADFETLGWTNTNNIPLTGELTIKNPKGVITITPANISVYTGGEGYTGVVNGSGELVGNTKNGLPEPGYYVTLPEDLNAQLGGHSTAMDLSDILTLSYDDGKGTTRSWTLELYGTDAHSSDVEGVDTMRYIYRLVSPTGQDPVRLQLTDRDTNEIVTSDKFEPTLGVQHKEYSMAVYSGALNPNLITAQLELKGKTVSRSIGSGTGTLSVRGLTDQNTTTPIITEEEGLTGSDVTVLVPANTTYYVNGSKVALDEDDITGVKLLVDNLLDENVLVDYITEKIDSIPDGSYSYVQNYLDLVDTKNGNAYLTVDEGVDLAVYWRVPDNYKSGSTCYMVHFDALDRNYDNIDTALKNNAPDVREMTADDIVTVDGTRYFKFETASFSPFVLVYEKTSSGGGGGGTTRYTIKAEAGEGGSISPSGSVQVTAGADRTFTITPGADYQIADVLVDGESVGAVSSYTFKNVRANHTIQAVFEAKEQILEPDETGVSDWLNTTDHNAYMNGYDTGSFGPNDNMTRAEAAQLFYNLLLNKNVTVTVSFTDVPSDAWYSKAVNVLASLGMLNGVGGDLFEPERTITRAEFTALGMRFADLGTSGENIFSDVHPGDWFYDNVVGSIQYGWITGYSDGTFRPYSTITRAEAAVFTNRMLGRTADKDFVDQHADDLRLFPDVPETYWAYYPIVEASNSHEYKKTNGAEDWLGL